MLASLLFIVSNCLVAAVAVSLIHASQLARDNFNVIDLEENVFKTVSTIIPNVLIVFGAILLLIVVVGVLGLLVPRRKKLLTLWMALDNFMIIVLSLCAIAFLILRGNLRDDIDTNTANIWDDNNSITEAQALANLEVTFSCCGFQSPIDRPVSRSCLGPTPQFTTGCQTAVLEQIDLYTDWAVYGGFVQSGVLLAAIITACAFRRRQNKFTQRQLELKRDEFNWV